MITIDGRHYWDGGIVSNSPLDLLTQHCGSARMRIVVADLYPEAKALPTNLMEVLGRRDEIVFAERIRHDSAQIGLVRDLRRLVEGILSYATPAAQAEGVRQWPTYIQLMGDRDAAPDITRIVRQGSDCETAARDYDFSGGSIERHIREGREQAEAALAARR